MFLPPVIVWDPFLSIPSLNLQCVECNQEIKRNAWKLGTSAGLEPRLLHSIESTVVLISARYVCPNSHQFFTTDPRVLELITSEQIPFILFHKNGFLRSFVDIVIGLIEEGLSVSAVERFVSKQRKLASLRRSDQVINTLSLNELDLSQIIPSLLLETPYPSNDMICKCFLAEYMLNRKMYTNAMSRILAQESISFDHTFKVATNIGYLRSDGKWITQYDSVFIVLNEKGQVMAWQFTETTSMDNVKTLLLGVKERMDVGNHKTLIIADNCCSIKGKLIEVFGNEINVKLDLFHAVQRLTKKMPKRHPLYSLCITDLRLIFRQPDDLGYKRLKNTPNPVKIIDNLNKFIKKWSYCDTNGWVVLNENVLKEAKNLEIHINKGCLSDIPPGFGTNRNERLHRHIKPHFSRTRLGLPMALALMTVLLYQYNCKSQGKETERQSITLEEESASKYHYGISEKDVEQTIWGIHPIDNTYGFDKSTTTTLALDESVSKLITIEELMNIIEKGLHLWNAAKSMNSNSLFQYQFFPFVSSVSSIFFSNLSTDAPSHSTNLDGIINSWKLKRQEVSKDGNCCFVAVAIGLQFINTNISSELKIVHPELRYNCVHSLSQQLRQIAVREWTNNSSYYTDFLGECNIQEEAEKFNQLGYFYSDLGDTVLHALSKALGIHFIVFTTLECYPVIQIVTQEIKCATPVYLAYNHNGLGHYDAVVPVASESTSTTVVEVPKTRIDYCTCGKNAVTQEAESCVPITSKYTTTIRCSCLKSNRMCTSLCRCVNCGNVSMEDDLKQYFCTHEKAEGIATKSILKRVLFSVSLRVKTCHLEQDQNLSFLF